MILQRTHLLFVLAALLLLGGVMGWAHQPVVLAEPANYDCAAQSAIPIAECEVLIVIYEANPTATFSGWLEDGSSPCNWSGVGCYQGVVTGLYIYHHQLTTVPAEIGQLNNLTYINLSYNTLTTLPPEIGQLSSLRELHLYNNPLTGPVPEFLTNLQLLQRFNFIQTDWCVPSTGPVPTWLDTIPWWTGSGLTCDATYDCAAQSAISVTECEALVAIYEANPDSDFFSGWLVDGSSPCDWSGVTCASGVVTQLDFTWYNLDTLPAEIGQLSNLQSLLLWGNRIAVVPPEIGQLSNLQYLSLFENFLTTVPAELWQLSNLQSLALGGNQLTAVPAEIGQLSNLQGLYLQDNQLTAVPAEIGQLSNLTELFLYDNQLTTLPAEIGQLSNLQSLHLSSNQLCALPTAITSLMPYLYLSVSHNHLAPTDSNLITWLDTYQPNWADTQTACPFIPSVVLSAPTDALDMAVGQTVMYTVHITNTGDAHDIFTLTATNQTWATSLPVNMSLAAGAAETFAVQVHVPLTATNGAQDSVLLTAVSSISETVTGTINLTTTAVAPPEYGVSLTAVTTTITSTADTAVTYTLSLTNTGNITDTYTLTPTGASWPTQLPISLTVGAEQVVQFELMVTIPATATHGQQDVVTVTATSQGNETTTDEVMLTTTAVVTPPPETEQVIYLPLITR